MYENTEWEHSFSTSTPSQSRSKMGMGDQRQTSVTFNPGEESRNLFVKEAGWAPELVWSGLENGKSLDPIGVRNPNPTTCKDSSYRLSYCGPVKYL